MVDFLKISRGGIFEKFSARRGVYQKIPPYPLFPLPACKAYFVEHNELGLTSIAYVTLELEKSVLKSLRNQLLHINNMNNMYIDSYEIDHPNWKYHINFSTSLRITEI